MYICLLRRFCFVKQKNKEEANSEACSNLILFWQIIIIYIWNIKYSGDECALNICRDDRTMKLATLKLYIDTLTEGAWRMNDVK